MTSNEISEEQRNKMWKASITSFDEEKEFEETRRCLLNSYNSYVQNHSGYTITVLIGFFAVIFNFDAFLKTIGGTIVFVILLFGIISATIFFALRIVYWSIWVSVTITILPYKAIEYFNTRRILIPINKTVDYFNTVTAENKYYFYKSSYMSVLQFAISRQIREDENKFPWFKKLALIIAGKSL